MKSYRQCHLRRRDGDRHTTGWIEVRGARVGASVEIKPDDTLWEVISVAETPTLREDQLREHQLLNRRSLPSVEAMR